MRFLLHTVHFLYKVVKYPVWSGNIEGEMHMEIQILPLIIVVAYLVGMLVVGAVVSKVQIKNATIPHKFFLPCKIKKAFAALIHRPSNSESGCWTTAK